MLKELQSLLQQINDNKQLILKTQQKTELKIQELDKLLDKIATNNLGLNKLTKEKTLTTNNLKS